MEPKNSLYVVATPIGNLKDITLRALEVLRMVDLVVAEDTRNTGHLLHHFSIQAQLLALHEHNERAAAREVVDLLLSGKSVALVSDAGTPGISDPGALLVAMARQAGLRVVPVPGANAAISALSAAGIADTRFLFCGFLPHKKSGRRRELEQLKDFQHTLVIYESPHRIMESVSDMREIFGDDREIIFARELTKIFETIHVCRLGEALKWLGSDPHRQKGEFVLLLAGASLPREGSVSEEAQRVLEILLAELPVKQAARMAAEITSEKKNALYELALEKRKAENQEP